MWRHDFFLLPDIHLQRVYLQEESLPRCLSNGPEKTLQICSHQILSSVDK